MKKYDLVIKNGTVVFPYHGETRCEIGIKSGSIACISDEIDANLAEEVLDAKGKYVFPAAIDSHYHVGIYRPHSEDAESESRTALVGGVGTIISYFRTGHHYLNKTGPYREILPEVLSLSQGHFYTDYCYHIAPMTADQLDEVQWMVEQAGIASFKFYMFYKGLTLAADSTHGSQYTMTENYDLGHLYELMTRVSVMAEKYRHVGRISLSLHCENPELIRVFIERVKQEGLTGLKAYSEARPPLTEKLSVHEAAILADATGCPINLLHLSSREALQAGIDARRNYPNHDIKLEVTLHHLALDYEELDRKGIGMKGKVNPPIRTKEHSEFLWEGIRKGHVDTVVSDHACCGEEHKKKGIWESLPGFGGSSILYPILLSEGAHKRKIPLHRIAELVSANPAKIFGLYPKKGSIMIGSDADFTIIDMNVEKTVTAEELLSAQDHTPFEGFIAKGWSTQTIVRGKVMFDNGKVTQEKCGQFIKRPIALHYKSEEEGK
ncbi:MAG: dihydroorotase family protein [Pyrinomonadaceae bacterium]|nr:dihydroorotase family protein [Pyrinomonadaceae bacterium]MCX7639395.1 dihydroorotase family protein [Pyrinomonadaceae bacterium]MDW8304555.1 dihydroorotase family protein [Acidobacteriota bacterium]